MHFRSGPFPLLDVYVEAEGTFWPSLGHDLLGEDWSTEAKRNWLVPVTDQLLQWPSSSGPSSDMSLQKSEMDGVNDPVLSVSSPPDFSVPWKIWMIGSFSGSSTRL